MDIGEDTYKAFEEAARLRNHGKRYMNTWLANRFDSQRQGNPFEIPETPDELELMVGWFFDRLRVIVSIENHKLKFDGVRQVIDILHDAAEMTNNSARFAWVDGQWYIPFIESKEDVLALPKLLKVFSKLYRHHANEYAYGDQEEIHFIEGGAYGHLTIKSEFEVRKRRETGL